MSEAKPRVTVVGLGLIGGSVGMALRQAELTQTVVGHDKDRGASSEAKKLGAVDRTDWNLVSACEGSDLVILAIPLSAIEATLEAIGPYLRPGCVVMDTATVKEPVMAWASQSLPENVHFVGGNPVIGARFGQKNGLEDARADLFQSGLFCLVPSPGVDADAVKLATDLVSVLGAKPLFLDAAEHDGLMAAVDHLPSVLSLALLDMVVNQPTWRELRKVAGQAFETSSHVTSADPVALGDLCVSNRDNLLRWIDAFSASLASIRQILGEGQTEVLADRFRHALVEREKWLAERAEGKWQEGPRPEIPPRPSLLDGLFGTFWRRGPKRDA